MSGFSLKADPSTADGFASRCKDIFAGLNDITPKASQVDESKKSSQEIRRSPKSGSTSEFRGRESIFRVKDSDGFSVPRRPDLQRYQPGRVSHLRGGVRTPDHVRNPRKYTKYSLADVDDISDRSNARAAFDFLRQQQEQKAKETDDNEAKSLGDAKITFKRPVKQQRVERPNDDTVKEEKAAPSVSVGFSKRVLPECVVGAGPRFGRPKREAIKILGDGDDDELESEETRKRKAAGEDSGSGESAKPSKKKQKKSIPKLSFSYDAEDE